MTNKNKSPRDFAELESFLPIIELIPQVRQTVRTAVNAHLKTHLHSVAEITAERQVYRKALAVLQKKWTMDIIFVLNILNQASYNELKKNLQEINSRSLTDSLLFLEQEKILTREVINTRPFRVRYELTEYGKGLYDLLLPASFFFILGREKT
jgi:DNA-binding HxlR family transcriptional regulator